MADNKDKEQEKKAQEEQKAKNKKSILKIIDNTYHSTEIDTRPQKFAIDQTFMENKSEEEKIHFNLLFEKIHEIILASEKFSQFNKIQEKTGKIRKLNKIEVNEVYSFVINRLPDYERMDIFSVLSEYFDIDYVRCFNTLSNLFKEQLISELDKQSSVLEKRRIRKLF